MTKTRNQIPIIERFNDNNIKIFALGGLGEIGKNMYVFECGNEIIIVDCGIASGADVFKALALGADGAAVGRSMLPSLEKEGVAGASNFIRKVGRELRYIMSFTGFSKIEDINDSVLHFCR